MDTKSTLNERKSKQSKRLKQAFYLGYTQIRVCLVCVLLILVEGLRANGSKDESNDGQETGNNEDGISNKI